MNGSKSVALCIETAHRIFARVENITGTGRSDIHPNIRGSTGTLGQRSPGERDARHPTAPRKMTPHRWRPEKCHHEIERPGAVRRSTRSSLHWARIFSPTLALGSLHQVHNGTRTPGPASKHAEIRYLSPGRNTARMVRRFAPIQTFLSLAETPLSLFKIAFIATRSQEFLRLSSKHIQAQSR